MIMPGIARRNRVFGGTLKLRDYERTRAGSRRRRGTTSIVVVVVIVVGGGGGLPASSCNVN